MVDSAFEAMEIPGHPTPKTSADTGIRCIPFGVGRSMSGFNRGHAMKQLCTSIVKNSWQPGSAYSVMQKV